MFTDMGSLASDAYPALLSASEAYFRQAMEEGRYIAWFGEIDGQTIAGGGIHVNTIPPRPGPGGKMLHPGPQGLIVNVYVEPSHRKQGVARALMAKILNFAKLGGFSHLVLHSSDAGRPMYESLGFEPTSEMRLYL